MSQPKFRRVESDDPSVVGSGFVFGLLDWHFLTKVQVEGVSSDVVDWCQQTCVEKSWKVTRSEFSMREPAPSYGAGNYEMFVYGEGAELHVCFQDKGDAAYFTLTWC